jgi:hypothetical protein
MMQAKRFSLGLSLLVLGIAMPQDSSAGGLPHQRIPIHFAVLLENDNPIAGDAICIVGQNCKLLETEHPELQLTLNLERDNNRLVGELTVRCEDECSFANGRPTVEFQEARQFDFFLGQDGINIPLVLKPKEKVGRVLLIYP